MIKPSVLVNVEKSDDIALRSVGDNVICEFTDANGTPTMIAGRIVKVHAHNYKGDYSKYAIRPRCFQFLTFYPTYDAIFYSMEEEATNV